MLFGDNIMKMSDVDKKVLDETATAGGTSAGAVASTANGFANGGIGTLSRAGTVNNKKKKKKARRR